MSTRKVIAVKAVMAHHFRFALELEDIDLEDPQAAEQEPDSADSES
ncbi:hypothetical protein [Streptomyces microflavus]|uniref:Uncharacterized protein n=1 Tax=Streptomyces microflavus TaxID=1919 RepID=A0A7H8N0G9_STRMI|nr:hypothetical protein [Streptomyces microflavus]QKW47909.1 hypothetical protein HUT09_35935 [Streptomyces microflavus]